MNEDFISVEHYARLSHTELQFIEQLSDCGLIELIVEEQMPCLHLHQLPLLEKYARLHYDLQINVEGIEAISHLLQQIETMQAEMEQLRRVVKLHEPQE